MRASLAAGHALDLTKHHQAIALYRPQFADFGVQAEARLIHHPYLHLAAVFNAFLEWLRRGTNSTPLLAFLASAKPFDMNARHRAPWPPAPRIDRRHEIAGIYRRESKKPK